MPSEQPSLPPTAASTSEPASARSAPSIADASTTGHTAEPPRSTLPKSLGELFWAFTVLALQGFGGVVAVVQRELVERRKWLTTEEFIEDWAVAQVLPGPNIGNMAVILGDRYFGWRGAIVALCGIFCLPLVVVLVLGILYTEMSAYPAVAGALHGLSAVAAGLIAGVGLKMLPAFRKHPLGMLWSGLLIAASFLLVTTLRWPLAWVLGAVGGTGFLLSWRRLK